MKTKSLLLLPCLGFLAASSLLGQNPALAEPVQEMGDGRWEEENQLGSGASTFQQSQSDSSPMMMFRPGGQAEKAGDHTSTEGDDQRMRTAEEGARDVASQAARGSAAAAMAEKPSEEDINQSLEDDICNNIYQSCLLRVAEMSLDKKLITGGRFEEGAKEVAEWVAKEKVAIIVKEKCERSLAKAKEETLEAKERRSEAEQAVTAAAAIPKKANSLDKAVDAANLAYQEACVEHA